MQRYSSDGTILLKTYPGCRRGIEGLRPGQPNAPLIKGAAEKKTLYKGFRWAMLDRGLPDHTVQNIGVDDRGQDLNKQGFVAMFDLDEERIVRVFADQKAAAEDRRFRASCTSTAIKLHRRSGGHYFKMWHDCEDVVETGISCGSRVAQPPARDPMGG